MRFWKLITAAILAVLLPLNGGTAEMLLFRIGTGGAGGTYYPIGGLIALAISNPPGSRPCEQGGSCGVPGLVAIAQSSNGSVTNAQAVQSGALESAFVQSDVAYWAYTGTGGFERGGPSDRLRTIASLYSESIHLVVRVDAGIDSVKDLRGKRVSLDEPGSGTLTDALLVLQAYGIGMGDFEAEYMKPELAAEKIRNGQLDAFFFVAGYPALSVSRLADETGVDLVPINGPEARALVERHRFFSLNVIPGGTYSGVGETPTVSVGVRRLIKDGWMEQRDDPNDGRARPLFLTEKGDAFVNSIRQHRTQTIKLFLSGLSTDEQEQLISLLDRAINALEKADVHETI